jgi:two-component system alkaline phosphatase synthesis response regulator PhoP
MRVLLASAASRFRDQLEELLGGQGYQTSCLNGPATALAGVREGRPHLLVIVEPYFEGKLASFLSDLRRDASTKTLPILCVAPTADTDFAVSCLDAGADDFIHRPFNAQIFLARSRTLLRRRAQEEPVDDAVTIVRSGPLTIKLLTRQVLLSDEVLVLTRLEFELLAYLARHQDRVFKREELLAAVWNYPGNVETRTLDKHVESLRRKLGSSGPLIETVHGVGYRFGVPAKRASR